MKPWTSLALFALVVAPSLVPADTCQEAREDAVVYYNPRPFYYWGFIAGMWGGAMMSTSMLMIPDTAEESRYMLAGQGACVSGIPLFVAFLKRPSPSYDVLSDVPADQRTQYSRCYGERADAAQTKAAFTGTLFGTLSGALFFGGMLYLLTNAVK